MLQKSHRAAAVLGALFLLGGLASTASACHRSDCCCVAEPVCCPSEPVCCKPTPPPMVSTTICLVDPCTCCTKQVRVCIPACCCAEPPCISCRKGLFGRKIYTVKWSCCGHCVDVVWTKHGRVKVRG